MSWMARTKSVLRRWLRSRQVEEELDGEVRAYFDTLVSRLVAEGLSEEEARRAARLKFDTPDQVKEKVRDVRLGAGIETAFQDLRYAWRVLRNSPGFTTVAVLTLALGIGANTAIFSLINAVMLRALPVQHPGQLVLLTDPAFAGTAVDTTEDGVRNILSYPEFRELRDRNTVFAGMLAAQSQVPPVDVRPSLSGSAEPLKARLQLVSGEFFGVLGVQPVLGRAFTAEEDRTPGANPVAVISYDFWQRQLGGDAAVLGSTLRAGKAVLRILGVAPPGFHGILVGSDADAWIPLSMQAYVIPGRDYLTPRDTLWLQVMARLAPGVSRAAAQAGINVTFQQALQSWAATLPAEKERRSALDQQIQLRSGARGASALRGAFSDPLLILMTMVGVVLLIACANIANLMLARASGRQREIGVRLALGAARLRLIRQLLTESLLVAVLGGVVGILLAAAGTRLLIALVSAGDGLGLTVPTDLRVLGFTAATALLTGILFGLAPAIRAVRQDVNRTLDSNARGAIGGRGRIESGRLLAIAQIALSLVLLIGAALFARSLRNLATQNLGIQHHRLLAVRVDPIAAGFSDARTPALYEKLRDALRGIPGVQNVTLSNTGIFTNGDSADHLSIEGSPIRDPEQLRSRWTEVGPDYFTTVGIPLLQGRQITAGDLQRGLPICVINESFARRFYPNLNPMGRHVRDEYPTTRETFEIVGVVADAREHRPGEAIAPRFYSNIGHPIGSVGAVTFLVRSTGDPARLAEAVRRTIRQLDPDLPVISLRTVDEEIGRRLATDRLIAELAMFFAGLALFMAAIGLYGVISYAMTRRTAEIGIRMALGASRGTVLAMILRETLLIGGAGVAIGLAGALASGKLIVSKLYGLTAADPAAIMLATAVVLSAALLAGYLPARRAARIDPMVSLRCE